MTSSSPKDREAFLDRLLVDFAVYQAAQTAAARVPTARALVRTSMFNTVLVREVALIATTPTKRTNEAHKEDLVRLATGIFSGWGQTKVVEDMFKVLRHR